MRVLLAAGLLFGLTACSPADEKKEPAKKDPAPPKEPALKVGDPAPALKAEAWLNGPEAKIAPGSVYVLDFWATWCGPCIAMMPHLSELQREYKEQGLVVVAVTTTDKRNPKDAVEKFVAKRGPKLAFRFAVCESPDTDKAFMEASESDSLPTTFVVDKAGKIAFIGHPMNLDDVLPKVLAGTWRGAADVAELNRAAAEMGAAFEKLEKDSAAGLAALAAFEEKHPTKAARPMFRVSKLAALVQAQKYDEAKTLTEALLPTLTEKRSTPLLNNVRAIWADKDANPLRKHIDLATKAADAVLAVEGDKDPLALIGAAEAYFTAGNAGKAIEYGKKAVENAENEGQKTYFEGRVKEYEAAAKK